MAQNLNLDKAALAAFAAQHIVSDVLQASDEQLSSHVGTAIKEIQIAPPQA